MGRILKVSAPGILGNDTDAEGDPIHVAEVDNDPLLVGFPVSTSNGTVTLNVDGSFTFTPVTGFVGTASFKYKAQDNHGHTGNGATMTINVY